MNSPPQGGGHSPPQSPQAYRETMQQWRQQALAQRGQYEDHVRDQIQRSFQEYSPPLYASVIGFRRDWNLLVATSRVSGFASTLGRDLDDTEVKAITEYTLNNIHTNAAFKWVTLGLAAYMTYRGRRTWQFPFYKPKLGGKFNPNEATSIFSNKKIRGPYPRFTWHTLRFTAYAAVTMLMVEPVFRAVNFIRTESTMAKDPRLERFMKDATSKVEKVMSSGPARATQRQMGQNEPDINDVPPEAKESDYSFTKPIQTSATPPPPVWSRVNAEIPPARGQQPEGSWGGVDDIDDENEDDASPIAASARNQSSASTSSTGSAWDRLRQKSQTGQRSQQQSEFDSRGGWAGVGRTQTQSRPESQSESGWGSANSTGSEWGGPKESFSYSSADEERSLAKEQAQKEFDEMLERERQGDQQGRSWGSR